MAKNQNLLILNKLDAQINDNNWSPLKDQIYKLAAECRRLSKNLNQNRKFILPKLDKLQKMVNQYEKEKKNLKNQNRNVTTSLGQPKRVSRKECNLSFFLILF